MLQFRVGRYTLKKKTLEKKVNLLCVVTSRSALHIAATRDSPGQKVSALVYLLQSIFAV